MIAALALALPAAAQQADCSVPLGDADVRALAKVSSQAIFDDDPVTHKRVYGELVRLAPCLDHPVSRDAWAQLLLDEAIVRYVAKEPWQPVLATALAVRPDLSGVPQYLLDAFVAPPPPPPGPAVPEDAALFVDGVLVRRAPQRDPAAPDVHLVQLWRDGRMRSRYLQPGVPFPDDWLEAAPVRVVEVEKADDGVWEPAGRGAVGLGFGVLVSSQLVEDPGTWLADASLTGGAGALTLAGFQPVAGPGGAFWDAQLRAVAPSVRKIGGNPTFEPAPLALPAVWLGPAAVLEQVAVGLGGGVAQLQKVVGGVPTTMTLPQAHLVVSGRQGRGTFAVSGGASPSAGHAGMAGGWILSEVVPVSWRFGFDANFDAAWLHEAPPGERTASVLQLGVLVRVEAAWGEDR
ncbi:MAG: hypothetical protein R3F59_17105 [Myxococcota bacterium]